MVTIASVVQMSLPASRAVSASNRAVPPSGTALSILEARQHAHLIGVDAAYVEGYTVLREAAGQDLSAANLLADSYGQYNAFRRALLKDRLVDIAQSASETGSFTRHNRFILGPSSVMQIDVPTAASVPVTAGPYSSGVLSQSYLSWRRALLAAVACSTIAAFC